MFHFDQAHRELQLPYRVAAVLRGFVGRTPEMAEIDQILLIGRPEDLSPPPQGVFVLVVSQVFTVVLFGDDPVALVAAVRAVAVYPADDFAEFDAPLRAHDDGQAGPAGDPGFVSELADLVHQPVANDHHGVGRPVLFRFRFAFRCAVRFRGIVFLAVVRRRFRVPPFIARLRVVLFGIGLILIGPRREGRIAHDVLLYVSAVGEGGESQ